MNAEKTFVDTNRARKMGEGMTSGFACEFAEQFDGKSLRTICVKRTPRPKIMSADSAASEWNSADFRILRLIPFSGLIDTDTVKKKNRFLIAEQFAFQQIALLPGQLERMAENNEEEGRTIQFFKIAEGTDLVGHARQTG